MLQEGHQVGRAPFHLLQALELAVLLLCVLWGGDGGETVESRKGALGLPFPFPCKSNGAKLGEGR